MKKFFLSVRIIIAFVLFGSIRSNKTIRIYEDEDEVMYERFLNATLERSGNAWKHSSEVEGYNNSTVNSTVFLSPGRIEIKSLKEYDMLEIVLSTVFISQGFIDLGYYLNYISAFAIVVLKGYDIFAYGWAASKFASMIENRINFKNQLT